MHNVQPQLIGPPAGVRLAPPCTAGLTAGPDKGHLASVVMTPPLVNCNLLPDPREDPGNHSLRLTKTECKDARTVGLMNHIGGQLDLALIALPYDTANLLAEPLFDGEL